MAKRIPWMITLLCAVAMPILGQVPGFNPTSTQASNPTELAKKLLPAIQEIAEIDAPGAKEFASALAAVLKRHTPNVPEAMLAAKPSPALPRLTAEQLAVYGDDRYVAARPQSSKAMIALRCPLKLQFAEVLQPAEIPLRVEMLNAMAGNAPAMSLRLYAAQELMNLAWDGFADRETVIQTASGVVKESFKAVMDGRDTHTLQTNVSFQLEGSYAWMADLDLTIIKTPTRDSLGKSRKHWDLELSAMEKDAKDEQVKRLLGRMRSLTSKDVTDADVERITLPRQVRPLLDDYCRSVEKLDQKALLAMMSPRLVNAVKDAGIDLYVKQLFGGPPRKIGVQAMGHIGLVLKKAISVECTLRWQDQNGNEHFARMSFPICKTDQGWRMGEQ